MTIDWQSFTPTASLLGGILIGISAGLLILLIGRVAGISGIIGGLLRPQKGDVSWRLAFIFGLIASPFLYKLVYFLPEIKVEADIKTLVVAGLVVGIGTRYGSGCTSGHGVCGISRLSIRSIVATLLFMLSAFTTVFITRHILG